MAGRVQGPKIRVLVDSGSTGNYIRAQCQTGLELEVQQDADFERLPLADGSEVHAQGNVRFVLIVGITRVKSLLGYSQTYNKS